MADTMSDFLDFGDDLNDQFADEYANINRCEGSPSSEDVELNALDNSVSALSAASQNEVDLEMSDFGLGASLGSSWTGVSDSFSQMHVKAEPADTDVNDIFDDAVTIPGSWPSARRVSMKSNAMKNQAPVVQNTQLLQPTSFTMSQIAPPSLPQERSTSTGASSICSDAIKEEDETAVHESDLPEPAKKRRASESFKKTPVAPKAGHKRANSNASATPKAATSTTTSEPAITQPVGVEFDESGDIVVAKRQDRLMRNRAAALASRERKREHVMKLETSVVDLENERNGLRSQVLRMNDEISRIRKLLQDNGIHDEESVEFTIPESASASKESTPEEEEPETTAKSESTPQSRTKLPPTGFARGALKKSEIIANQIRAEAHLRNLMLKQQGLLPPEPAPQSEVKIEEDGEMADSETPKPSLPSETTTATEKTSKSSTSSTPGGSVVFMILIFGIALFANGTTVGRLNLTGFSKDPTTPGLLLNLPQNFADACPETVISQLRGQGFLLSEELGELERSNLLQTPSSLPIANTQFDTKGHWIANAIPSGVACDSGEKFSVTVNVGRAERDQASDSTTIAPVAAAAAKNEKDCWKLMECQVTKVTDLTLERK